MRFHYSLLCQSLVLLVVQTILLRKFLQIELDHKELIKESESNSNLIVDRAIKRLIVKLGLVFGIYLFIFMYFQNETFTEITGLLSSSIEALLPVPQFYNNWQKKSVKGVRLAN